MSGDVRLDTEDARSRGKLRELRRRPVDNLAVDAGQHRLNVKAGNGHRTIAGERDDGL